MKPRIHLITLGVADLPRALAFYEEGLGWKKSPDSNENVAFFQLGGVVLSLFPRHLLAADAGIDPAGTGFSGLTLAHNTSSEAEVDEVMAEVARLGATIVKPAEKVFWGGYSGYFRDTDGHLFEVAYNPFWPFDDRGHIALP